MFSQFLGSRGVQRGRTPPPNPTPSLPWVSNWVSLFSGKSPRTFSSVLGFLSRGKNAIPPARLFDPWPWLPNTPFPLTCQVATSRGGIRMQNFQRRQGVAKPWLGHTAGHHRTLEEQLPALGGVTGGPVGVLDGASLPTVALKHFVPLRANSVCVCLLFSHVSQFSGRFSGNGSFLERGPLFWREEVVMNAQVPKL